MVVEFAGEEIDQREETSLQEMAKSGDSVSNCILFGQEED